MEAGDVGVTRRRSFPAGFCIAGYDRTKHAVVDADVIGAITRQLENHFREDFRVDEPERGRGTAPL